MSRALIANVSPRPSSFAVHRQSKLHWKRSVKEINIAQPTLYVVAGEEAKIRHLARRLFDCEKQSVLMFTKTPRLWSKLLHQFFQKSCLPYSSHRSSLRSFVIHPLQRRQPHLNRILHHAVFRGEGRKLGY
ncbi:unnamed protein product [Cercospora beticola]|nr:unnamed protein product [Cercospora beticola]